MVNYEEALAIAKSKKSKINKCIEYNNGFAFAYDDGIIRDGGDSPVVVLKESGEAVNIIEFAVMPGNEIIREFEVK